MSGFGRAARLVGACAPGARVDTTRAPRRELTLRSLDDLLADVSAIAAAARDEAEAGVTPGARVGERLWVSGNWSAGQILQHVAIVMEKSLTGFAYQAPISIRAVGRAARVVAMSRPTPAGIRWPDDGGEFTPDAQVWTEAGADRLERVVRRVRAGERMTAKNPVLGELSHEDWVRVHLRHAELHLSFVHVGNERTVPGHAASLAI